MAASCKLVRLCGFVALCSVAAIASEARSQNVARRVEQRPAEASTALLRAGDVNIERSRVYVRIGATGLGHEHGAVARLVGGNIQLGASSNAGKLVFDLASFIAETPEARAAVGLSGDVDASTRKKVNENMLGSDVLDVKRFPQATLDVTSATLTSDSRGNKPPIYQLEGRFSLHGKTQPLRIQARAEVIEGLVRLRGRFSILQSDYGIKPYTKLGGVVGVADELTIWGEIWLQQPVTR
jgi:polyisoprenoid-binding protein YceI